MTAKDFSNSLRTLFNATYLNKALSEKALEILSQVNYKDGLAAGLPSDIKIAHKFGITGTSKGGVVKKELHDCGIVYANSPYFICVMTKDSTDLKKAQNVISKISSMAYDQLKSD
jgi:beta-lactamase class A